MIARLKPYPTMKDSGVPWLGEVPEHWEMRSLGSMTVARTRRGRPDLPLLSVVREKGVIPRATMSDDENHNFVPDDLSNYKVVHEGDLVINKMKAWQGSLGIAPMDGVVSPAYFVLDLQIENRRYGHALLRSKPYVGFFGQVSDGVRIGQWDLSAEGMKRIKVAIPSPPEQAAIVRFLDHAERRIRRYTRAKQKLIKLLEEQKQVIIHHAVTRGLDPNVRLKPSGVEWLGDVPDHWEVRRVKQTAQVMRGKFTHRPRNDPALYDGRYPFIQTGEVARAEKSITSWRQTLNERGLAVSRMSPAGTLVMSIAANIGDVAVLDFEACFPDSVVGFAPRNGIDRDFLYYAFRAMKPELLREAPVNTQGNLNVDRIGSRGIAVAPAVEQRLIVRHIEASTAGLNAATDQARREIALLHEYRTRLIADVVTGNLDVREAAATLPDEAHEPEPLDEAAAADADEANDAALDSALAESEA